MTIATVDSPSSNADTVTTPPPELARNVRIGRSPLAVGAVRMASLYLLFAHVLPMALPFVGLSPVTSDGWLTSLGSALFGWPSAREDVGGCGDRANDYLRFGLTAVGTAVAATVWTSLDRGRAEARYLPYWVGVLVRYYLASQMLMYGAVKVIKSQFAFPTPTALASTFAEADPKSLMWVFLGYSASYTVFLGIAEVIGGTLLLFRRTTLLGALLTSAVMANVFLLNVCYDVCVKLRSAELLAMSVALAVPDARRLYSLFIQNQPVPARDLARPMRGRRLDRAFNVVKGVAIASMVGLAAFVANRGWTVQGGGAPVSAWQGTWIVQTPALGAPPPADDHRDWAKLAFDERSALVRRADGSASRLLVRGDAVAGTLELRSKRQGPDAVSFNFGFEQPEPDVLVLTSTSPASTLRLKRQRSEEQPLLAHELRWISDLPSAEQSP